MVKKTLPLFIVTLITGILVGCGSSNPYVDEAKSNIREGKYQAALEAAELSIKNQPLDPLGYYYKGVVLGDLAQETENPADRQEQYEKMNAAFDKSQELAGQMEDPPGELENLNAVKMAIWSNEHNRAIELATDDSLKNTVDQPVKRAIEHLQNATTIIPDSTLSWDVLSEVYFMDKDVENAIEAKKKVIAKKNPAAAEDYIRLADFYRVGEQSAEAVELLQEAQTHYPGNIQIVEKLADAYMSSGKYEEAVATVEELIAIDPENPQYHLALGTQYYQTALRLTDSLSANYDKVFELQQTAKSASGSEANKINQQISSLQNSNESMQQRVDALTDKAVKELNTVLEYRTEDATAYFTLGIIYQNNASALMGERNQTTNIAKADQLDKQAKEQLRHAMGYYEKAVEIDPNNKQYWQRLFKIYVVLGMDEKAKEAEKKSGL